jgi:S-adenosylmethionine synthetase
LTGRKIILEKRRAHGGCFSGKDPSKVDEAVFLQPRHHKKYLLSGVADEILVQVSPLVYKNGYFIEQPKYYPVILKKWSFDRVKRPY